MILVDLFALLLLLLHLLGPLVGLLLHPLQLLQGHGLQRQQLRLKENIR